MLMYGLVLLGTFRGATQTVGSAVKAPAGEGPETTTGSKAHTVHA